MGGGKKDSVFNCGLNVKEYAERSVVKLKETIGDKKALLALSGGVDSSVCCALTAEAIGSRLTCIFVDTGLMRKNEGDEVENAFSNKNVNFIRVNASERFLRRLKGVIDPEEKRKIIGEEFIRVFEEEAKKLEDTEFFIQGTIYTDVIESGQDGAKIVKSHHNVGGLPEKIGFKEVIEPLKPLYKNEVRELGKELGLPDNLINRQIFPGPGLAIRVIGEITFEKLEILREADYIFRSEIINAGLDNELTMYFAILTGMRSVGVKNGERTYDYTLALRAITSTDIVTADFGKIPYNILERVSERITAEVKEINRVVYDITKKPPSTIEWE